MRYTEIVGFELRNFNAEYDEVTLADSADRVLHEARELLRGWSDEEPVADFTLTGRNWEVVEVWSGRYVLLNNGAEFTLINVDNIRQYAWAEFAETAPTEMTNTVSAHTLQRAIALAKMMELWA